MNRTIAKISYTVFSVLALIIAQFWSCSTAQSLGLQRLEASTPSQKEQVQEEKSNSVLVFKLLSPIKPNDNKQVITVSLSKGNHTDKTISCLPTINPVAMPFLLADLALSNWAAYSFLNQEDSFAEQGFLLPTQGRAPPFSI